MNEYSFFKNPFVPLAFILGIALILATGVGAWAVFAVRGLDNTISVTGSAKTSVTADAVKMSFNISRTATAETLTAANAALDADIVRVRAFLTAQSVPESEITIDPATTNEIYDGNNQGPTRYMLTRSVRINSTRVTEIRALADRVSSLSVGGAVVQGYPPEYYYTKLADLRVSLLGEAVKDAKARAEAIAKESGRGVGNLQSSSSGVVQVLAPNSIDVSDYGQYDTSSVEKEVMITVRTTFQVQ
jgi:hypothetical protein